MRKYVVAVLALCLAASLFACTPTPSMSDVQTASVSPGFTQCPTGTPIASQQTTEEATQTPSEVSSEAPSPTPLPTGPAMYSSYAHLVSFDPDTGIAQFDYFDMLRGDEAVQYLVEHEDYTEAEAQNYVDDFADSEFIEKNTNPQLRAIDVTHISLSLMYQPSGAAVTDATPIPSTYSDFLAIWALNPALLLDHYFYYIHVADDGHVYLVEQVYWP